tara:strand:- start:1708 stop:3006 length:1299 start_codon:yes stop_codon:yes gene_type:complete
LGYKKKLSQLGVKGNSMKKVLVRGPALSRSGYGEHARFVLRSLKKHQDKFDIYLINTGWGNTGWLFEDSEERRWLDAILLKTTLYGQQDGAYDLSMQVTIPNEWEPLAPINIGVTAGIETTQVDPEWIVKSHVVDKIITVSEHSKNVYEKTSYVAENQKTGQKVEDFRCKVPIDVVHYPVRHFEPQKMKLDLKTDFNFLAVAQWGPRKNLENTVRWFVEEFIDQNIGLILKANIVNNSIIDREEIGKRIEDMLKNYPQRKCKVYVLHGDNTDEEMAGLYTHPKIKALVSLTHGEGFGLPLFEAAYMALPIIAPDWSGHLDFLYVPTKDKKGKIRQKPHFAKLDYDISPVPQEAVWNGVLHKDSMWCYPKQGSYKMRLRELFKDHGRFKSQANKLQKWVIENFEAEKQYDKMVDSVISVCKHDVDSESLAVFD